MTNLCTLLAGLALALATPLHALHEPRVQDPVEESVKQEPEPTPPRPPLLGLRFGESEGWGIPLSSITTGGAAQKAGLAVGDRLLAIAGRVTETGDEARAILREHWAGDRVQLVYRRGDRVHVVECVLGARREALWAWHEQTPELEEILGFLEVQAGQEIAEIGFGTGWLTLGLAKATGLEGRVYAVEIDEGSVQRMRQRKIPNITVVHSKKDDVLLEEGSIELAVLCDVASHVEKAARPGFYASLAEALRPGGRLAVFGPHGEAERMIEELAGFDFHPRRPEVLAGLSEEELDERLRLGIEFVHRPEPPDDGR